MSWSIICQRIIYSSSNSVLRYYQSWSFYKLVWVHLDRSYFKHYIVHRKSELWCSGILNANFILDKALFYTMIYIKQIIISHNFYIKKRYSIIVCYLLLWCCLFILPVKVILRLFKYLIFWNYKKTTFYYIG